MRELAVPGGIAATAASYLRKTLAIAAMEVRKLRHDPTELASRAVQPVLWLLIFGQVMSHGHAMDTGGVPYLDYLVPGILAQSVLFIAIFNGISIIWERDMGIVHKFLVSPTPRSALVMGKALGGGARAIVQGVVVLIVGAVAGERFMGVGQVLTMPLFFASNAIYPTAIMPPWLQVVAHANPLTYEIDALRQLLLPAHEHLPHLGVGLDLAVLLGTLAIMVAISARLYPRIAR